MRRSINVGYFSNQNPQVNAPLRGKVFAEFDVPISEIDEMLPAVVAVKRKIDLHKRAPFGAFGFAHQMHARLIGCAVGLVGVAPDAGADDVFPSGGATPIPRYNMVQVQIFAIEYVAAVLAGVLITLKNVVAGEFHLFFRHPVIHEEQDNARNADAERDAVDGFVMRGVG